MSSDVKQNYGIHVQTQGKKNVDNVQNCVKTQGLNAYSSAFCYCLDKYFKTKANYEILSA